MSGLEAHFDRLHREHEDFWDVRGSWYERRRGSLLLAALPRERYASAWEPGCSVGVITTALAGRCDEVLATDSSAAAVQRTRRATGDLPGVQVRRLPLPAWPGRSFELVLVSEVLYYLPEADFRAALPVLHRALLPGGQLLAVHVDRRFDDFARDGARVHAALAALRWSGHPVLVRDSAFRLDVWTR